MTAFSAKKKYDKVEILKNIAGSSRVNKQSRDFKEYSRVRTFDFIDKILAVCKIWGDEWALSVQ